MFVVEILSVAIPADNLSLPIRLTLLPQVTYRPGKPRRQGVGRFLGEIDGGRVHRVMPSVSPRARWLPAPRILHPWPGDRFDVRTLGKSPVR